MRHVKLTLARIFQLSQAGQAFFLVTVGAHVLLKLCVGLTLVFDDGYGFRSLVAPPQSIVFAGADVLACFAVAKLVDVLVPLRWQRGVQGALLFVTLPFLITSVIVHSYFKTFLNRGLLEFNGASAHEITDYTVAGLNRFSVTFVLLTSALFAAYFARFDAIASSRLAANKLLPTWSLMAAVGAMAYVGTLSSGQSGFLSYNPGFQLVRSYLSHASSEAPRASADEARAFRDPGPLHGTYDDALDVQVPSQSGRNVLFVLIESLPFEQTMLGGASEGMPVLSELAENGVVFDNFRTVFPATSRSFLTYHCGIYPSTGAASATKYRPGYKCDSILDGLKSHGYRTGFFTAPMFTYDNLHKADFMRSYDAYEDFLSLKSQAKRGSLTAPAVEEEVVAERLLKFVDERPNQPFFATYFMFWNHAPYRLPFDDISALRPLERYRKTLTYLDGVLRGLLASLQQRGVLENTVVVVAADHGEGFALHHDNTNHVGHIYEDDVRIPFVVHVPKLGAHRTHRQASNVDFAPTLFRLLGLPRAPSWQGQDLLGADFQPRPTLLFGRASYVSNGVVDGNLKYIEYPETGNRMLFDLDADPHEQRNLLSTRTAEANDYRTLVGAWLRTVEWRAWALSDQRANPSR